MKIFLSTMTIMKCKSVLFNTIITIEIQFIGYISYNYFIKFFIIYERIK